MHKIVIIGFLGGDAEIIKTTNSEFSKFTVAVDESYKNKEGIKVEQTIWYNCIINDAKNKVIPFIKKGNQIYIEGRPKYSIYIDKKDKHCIDISIAVEKIQLLGKVEKKVEKDNDTPF